MNKTRIIIITSFLFSKTMGVYNCFLSTFNSWNRIDTQLLFNFLSGTKLKYTNTNSDPKNRIAKYPIEVIEEYWSKVVLKFKLVILIATDNPI
jgi:hypothetical protein